MSITLPVEMARLVKQKVSSGAYASESEVIREGLRALEERDAVVERWLREEAALAYDAHKANPTKAAPLADVVKRLETHMDKSTRSRG